VAHTERTLYAARVFERNEHLARMLEASVNRVHTSLFLVLSLAVCALLGACSQDDGDTCQLDSDCASGLVCCKGAVDRGVCETKAVCESGVITEDSGSPNGLDAAREDAAQDAAMSQEDSGLAPMSMDDAGDSDGG
jgi:hypothetical protein